MNLSSHGIVALVRNEDGKFLLLQEARKLMNGLWAPPHGRCKPSDASEEAAVMREVKEETGLAVTPIKKVHTQPADTKVKTVSFWLVSTTGGTSALRLNAESSHADWFSLEQALELELYPGTRSFLLQVREGDILVR